MINVYSMELDKVRGAWFNSYHGFKALGCHCHIVEDINTIEDTNKDNIAIGGLGYVRDRLRQLGIEHNDSLDYPESIREYLGRELWTSTINTVSEELPYCFIKPKYKQKFFTGKVITGTNSLIGTGIQGDDYEVWCSEVIDIIAEFRTFVRYDRILDVRPYKGKYNVTPDYKIIEECVKKYSTEAPKAYAIDFCVTEDGKTLLMEVNDAYALGDYGLFYLDYDKLVYTRWAEIVHIDDYFKSY